MPFKQSLFRQRRRAHIDFSVLIALLAVLLFFVGSGLVAWINIRSLKRNSNFVAQTHDVILALDNLLSLLKDAETGQRGFVLTGEDRYLEPYRTATTRISRRLEDIVRLTSDTLRQQSGVSFLQGDIDQKLEELAETIDIRRKQGFEAAQAIVLSDRGRTTMTRIRDRVGSMQEEERNRRQQRLSEMEDAYTIAIASTIVTGVLGVALSIAVAWLILRAMQVRWHQQWLLAGESGMNQTMVGDLQLEQLGAGVLKYLAEYLDAQAGAFFAREAGHYRRVATYGVPADVSVPERFGPGDGLLGQAIADKRSFWIQNVPDGYLALGSALGRGTPRHLAIVPVAVDNDVNGVLELGFVEPVSEEVAELLETVRESIGTALRSANYRAHLQNLLEETQRQSEELQAQQEELRVSNEELEEQGRALRESQSRLELQQAELEQTNTQLEEHMQLLETQRDDLTRAKGELERQADELEQASQYKSDFLANMSHELRTPLNSSLILARLLAENPNGNLSEEQIQFARSIETSGNELLNLINDILDLSKIEAGRMDVHPETVRVSRLIDELNRMFEPIATQKSLTLRTTIAPGCPPTLETDRQRFEQILRNLLSNALKFTEKGEVELLAAPAEEGFLSFTVRDTGIGIPPDQQKIIFDAFRQADGTVSRKYGGTGLGLSISRELARILGGRIELTSEPGNGSSFRLVVPTAFAAEVNTAQETARLPEIASPKPFDAMPFPREPARRPIVRSQGAIDDDRERLSLERRAILVVEDDRAFARILYELAREVGFDCLVAMSAEEAWDVAREFLPSAVILDVGLPDHSGLSVLDRLKHDRRTRHIPVHVVSASDYSLPALELGAVGHMLKPVKREELVAALNQIQNRLTQQTRRILLVEDDPLQLDSLARLLGSQQVETVGVRSASECLELLKTSTFDCMVLDLSLPDASGYSILETLSREDAYSFPPAIVYTGRDLSADEEQRLRRYSHSIIIKGAKSPERLLDEVTLFLHQVVAELPHEQQRMLEAAKTRDAAIEGRRILIVEDDVRNVFALTSMLEGRGAIVQIARNGREALEELERSQGDPARAISLILMDVMMPEMDGITATREIRSRPDWKKLPIIMLTAKAMKDDQEKCLAAGANDYMAKPLDVDKLLSLVRVWMPR